MNIKIFTRSKGHSAVAKAAYRSGQNLHCELDGTTTITQKNRSCFYRNTFTRKRTSLEKLYGTFLQSTAETIGKTYLDTYYHGIFEAHKGINLGWNIAAVDETRLQKVIGKPWTADGKTFSDRIWGQKQQLVNEVHAQLTRNMILGRTPDASIKEIAKKFNVSNSQAGRLV